jgi:hypothetical protein
MTFEDKEIGQNMIVQWTKGVEQLKLGSMKKVLKIFNGFFNEKNEAVEINDKQSMIMILKLFLGPVL